jgi:hypothetical protein
VAITTRIISNLHEFIESLKKDLPITEQNVWYRGHENIEWKLQPSIFRKKGPSEMKLIKEFQKYSWLHISPTPQTDYEWLFIMRHYHVSTRLLDWTESPLVALYFSVKGCPDNDGALWILLPFKLNEHSNLDLNDPDSLPSFREDSVMKVYSPEDYYLSKRELKNYPVAILAPRNTLRMQVQLSVFTISVNEMQINEVGDKKHSWFYKIPKEAKGNIMKELQILGITESQLFPELETIGKEIEMKLK